MNVPNSKEIQEKQNTEDNLIIQAAAGHYYNLAEYLNYACWGLCAVSIIFSFFSDHLIIAVLAVSADLLALIFGFKISKYTNNAGDLRGQFDDRVLMAVDKRNEKEKRWLKEIAIKYSQRWKKSCQVQIHNSGRDNPPGKKDWYEFSDEYDSIQAQIECLKQNAWWNDKLSKYGRVVIMVLHLLVIVCIVVALVLIKLPLAGTINAAGVLFFRYIDRIWQNIKYWKTTIKAETALDIVSEHPSLYGIEKCMQYINEYRHISVFACSFIHRIRANKLAELYEKLVSKDF